MQRRRPGHQPLRYPMNSKCGSVSRELFTASTCSSPTGQLVEFWTPAPGMNRPERSDWDLHCKRLRVPSLKPVSLLTGNHSLLVCCLLPSDWLKLCLHLTLTSSQEDVRSQPVEEQQHDDDLRTPSSFHQNPAGPVQPGLYRWHHYRKPWRVFEPQPGPEQLLDQYQWRTSEDQNLERPHLFGLLRTSTLPRPQNQSQNQNPDLNKHGSLHRIIPFFRSMSEPGATSGSQGTLLRKAGSDAEHRAPSVSSFISTLSRRISRVLRDEPEPESGRRVQLLHVYVCLCYDQMEL
ncbi:hypothetical protein GOODEAATRI_001219 [Goodea atripinnis]|uniref:Uncharacterized protein n=1 Tax=Goodea atripinnis TaxID=208336 RepID=A0ABV0PAF0_9TELE